MQDLSKIKLKYSQLTKTIYLYRHGKDPALALDMRKAEHDVMAVLIEMMLDDMPDGAKKIVSFGDKSYDITVKPNKAIKAWNEAPRTGEGEGVSEDKIVKISPQNNRDCTGAKEIIADLQKWAEEGKIKSIAVGVIFIDNISYTDWCSDYPINIEHQVGNLEVLKSRITKVAREDE